MQGKTLSDSNEALSRKLASLRSLPIKQLKKQWRSLYGSEPPHRVSRELLIRAVAYPSRNKSWEGSNHPLVGCWSVSPVTRALENH